MDGSRTAALIIDGAVGRGPSTVDILIIVGSVLVILVAITVPIGLLTQRRAERLPPSMTMSFPVGTSEVHAVEIAYRQGAVRLTVDVDGVQIIRQSFSTGIRLTRALEWTVGVREPHVIRLVKTRPRLYGGLRRQQFVASVDGVVVAQAESNI